MTGSRMQQACNSDAEQSVEELRKLRTYQVLSGKRGTTAWRESALAQRTSEWRHKLGDLTGYEATGSSTQTKLERTHRDRRETSSRRESKEGDRRAQRLRNLRGLRRAEKKVSEARR
jgi:hypothetical protein